MAAVLEFRGSGMGEQFRRGRGVRVAMPQYGGRDSQSVSQARRDAGKAGPVTGQLSQRHVGRLTAAEIEQAADRGLRSHPPRIDGVGEQHCRHGLGQGSDLVDRVGSRAEVRFGDRRTVDADDTGAVAQPGGPQQRLHAHHEIRGALSRAQPRWPGVIPGHTA